MNADRATGSPIQWLPSRTFSTSSSAHAMSVTQPNYTPESLSAANSPQSGRAPLSPFDATLVDELLVLPPPRHPSRGYLMDTLVQRQAKKGNASPAPLPADDAPIFTPVYRRVRLSRAEALRRVVAARRNRVAADASGY